MNAPPPFIAHQRRLSIGAETTPTTTSSSTISEISVAHTGTPRTKFLVPSIGSTTQRRWLKPLEPSSSPTHRVPRAGAGQRAADAVLDRPVGVGHRGQVRLGVDPQVHRLVAARAHRVGVVGEDVRQPQVVGVVGGHEAQAMRRTLPVPARRYRVTTRLSRT